MKILITSLLLIFTTLLSANNRKTTAIEYRNIADSFYYSKKFPKALDYYIKGMEEAYKSNDMVTYSACIGYIANIYTTYGDKYSCLSFLEKGYNTALKINNKDMQSSFLGNIVTTYCRLNDINNAKHYFELLKKTPKTSNMNEWQYIVLYNSARILTVEKKYNEAIAKHKKTLKYAKENKLGTEREMFQENEIALLYVEIKDYENALKWGKLCIKRAEETDNKELLINGYKVLANTYKGLNIKDKESKYFKLYTTYKDSLYNMDDFCYSKQKLFNKRFDDDKKHSDTNAIYITIIIILVIACGSLYIIFVKRNKNKNNKKKISESTETINLDETQKEELFKKISDVMNNKEKVFNPDYSLELLAKDVQSNTKYVSWIINNKYEKNFKAVLNEKRIEEACIMLDDEEIYKNYTIQLIYETIGYKNATSFIRAFKKIKGVTPVEYRNRKKTE